MSATILLPVPLPSGSIKIGQLLSDPLKPSIESLMNETDCLPLRTPKTQAGFEEHFLCDDADHLIARHSHDSRGNAILVHADMMSYTTLRDPLSAFRYTSRRASTQAYFEKAALQRQPLYYVTAIQVLSNSRLSKNTSGSPTFPKLRVRRQDSGISLNEQDGNVILALELRKVYCRIGSPEEPQRPSDIGYAYKYYRLQGEEKRQLAVGLGPAMDHGEFRALFSI